ncbi:MAG: tetratricopeptide repeat protein, partial [Candidatus Krumholzibacteria bacterium]|nr:tetratricopeptide repeat protein [Candidatus Krumholzibacteria bacterium]
ILAFSTCVFTFYLLAQKLWLSRVTGLLAAFLIAFSGPLIAATHGREFDHAPYAVLLASLQLFLFASYARTSRMVAVTLMGLTAFALLSVWEGARFFLVLFGMLALLAPGLEASQRKRLVFSQLAAVALAGILMPYLRAERFLLSWPSLFFVVATTLVFARHRLPPKIPAMVFVGVATILLSVLTKPFAAGGIDRLSEIEYWLNRFRYLTGKPDDPLSLTDAGRFLWTQARANPSAYVLFELFLPVLVLIPTSVLAVREIGRKRPGTVWFTTVASIFGTLLFVIDRSTIFVAVLAVFPWIAVSARALDKHAKISIVPIAAAALLILGQALSPRANPTSRLGSALGLPRMAGSGFVWASLGNADRELVRFLVSRTSVKDPLLAAPDISSLCVTFAGRTTVLTPGVPTRQEMQRTKQYMSMFYTNEDEAFSLCQTRAIKYVLYSIDLLLDTSRYSQSYGLGLRQVNETSLTYKMHFKPESLKHFNLVYQNDNYRLFKVTEEMEPFFLTDHPPVYQLSILTRLGGDVPSFYDNVIDVLATYQTAVDAQSQTDDEDAIRRFRYCLELAPGFTRAWLGLGDSLYRLGRLQAAENAYRSALRIAPDNSQALYNTALTSARLGNVDKALGLLDVLISSSRERAIIAQARELKSVLERGIPLESPRE